MPEPSASWPDWRTRIRTAGQALLAPLLGRRSASRPRRFHAYAIGLPRSGTHSIAAMFEARFRAAHEPALVDSLAHTMRWNRGAHSPARMRAILRWRDARLGLEMEAAHYLHHVAPLLAQEFAEARFVLTVRDPISWLESEINQNLRSSAYPFWRALERQRYEPHATAFPAEERSIEELGCAHPIAAYLGYWREHIQGVLDAVPHDRLLTLRTHELTERIPELAAFVGVDPDAIDQARSRSGVGEDKRFDLRASIDAGYLAESVERHCADLAARWFPEFA